MNGYDENYFSMLTAEKRVAVQNKKTGFLSYQWVKTSGARNEAFDCRVYSRAALRILFDRDDLLLQQFYMKAPWESAVILPDNSGGILPDKDPAVKPKTKPKPKSKPKPKAKRTNRGTERWW